MSETLLICGSRTYTDRDAIRKALSRLHKDTKIIHGGAKGADTLVGAEGTKLGLHVVIYEADWDEHGKRAGSIRNQEMLDHGKPDRVWAFFDPERVTPGTEDMMKRALDAGLTVVENPD